MSGYETGSEKLLNNYFQAQEDILKTGEKSGSIICPQCGGKIQFRIYGKDHIDGKCETEKCFSWVV